MLNCEAPSTITPTKARETFFELLKQVATNHQIVIVTQQKGENVALISESDLASLLETAYLLKSPKNAVRLLEALERSKAGKIHPLSVDELKQELGIV